MEPPVADSEDPDEIRILADRLEAEGDPRGPLLALELAAARAEGPDEARRLNRAAQALREAAPDLAWPPALAQTRAKLHAGMIVDGDLDQLRAAEVALEQLVSLRRVQLPARGIDEALEQLGPLRARGLAPDILSQDFAPTRDAARARGLRAFAAQGQVAPRCLYMAVADHHALAGWSGLRELEPNLIETGEVLDALAPLGLVKLELAAELIPVATALFADTLTHLKVPEPQYDLSGFRSILELPKLETLSIPASRGVTPEVLEIVASHPSIAALHVKALGAADIEALAPMGLRELQLNHLGARAAAALPRLQSLESLTILGGRYDAAPLAELSRLRELDLYTTPQGQLRLPASLRRLVCGNFFEAPPNRAPLQVEGGGQVETLTLRHHSDVERPSALFEQLRGLTLGVVEGSSDPLLDALPRSWPALERLEIWPGAGSWTWTEGPRILAALPHLRSVDFRGKTVAEIAALSHDHPDLSFNPSPYWPHVAGP